MGWRSSLLQNRRESPMPITYCTGDIFDNHYKAQALAHGCNCQGVMGAGIAIRFKTKYPAMFLEYRRRCRVSPRLFNLGDAFLWVEEGAPFVFNLGTQEYIGANATYPAVGKSLTSMRSQLFANSLTSVAIPKIGCGIGGLNWERVKGLIEDVFRDTTLDIYVYDKYR